MDYEFSPQTRDEWREYFYIRHVNSGNDLETINLEKESADKDQRFKKIILDKKYKK